MKNLLNGKKIVERKIIWFIIPLVIIIIAGIAFGIYAGVNKDASQGVNIGIDFTGGTMVTVTVDDAQKNFDEYNKDISKIISDNGGKVSYSQLGEGSVVIRYGQASQTINDDIKSALTDKYGAEKVQITNIGATASKNLLYTAIGAVSLSTLLILIYIVIRFGFMSGRGVGAHGAKASVSEGFSTGLASVIALLHDVLMVIAFTIICHIQINSSFIAAIITIIAYSINNSIVLFDRVRENNINAKNQATVTRNMLSRNAIVNKSISQTVMRSINTTVTTMAAIVILAIIGVASIREFALPVIFGLVSGAFSSIFFAPSLYCVIQGWVEKFKNREKTPKDRKAKKANAADAVTESENA